MTTKPSLARFALRYARWLLLLTLAWLVVYCGMMNPQSGLRCTHHELDIHSGRTRVVEYYFWIRSEGSAEETWLSRALSRGGDVLNAPIWKRYGSKGGYPSLITMHINYRYGGDSTNIRLIQWLLKSREVMPDVETADAREVVRRWREEKTYSVQKYADSLYAWLSQQPEQIAVTVPMITDFHEQLRQSTK